MGDSANTFFNLFIVMVVFAMFIVLMIFQIQMRINSAAVTVQSTRQILQLDNAKSKMDQGYYSGEDHYLRVKNADRRAKNEFMTSYDKDGHIVTGSNAIIPDETLGIPTTEKPYKYGQPYGFYNRQKFRWKTIFNLKGTDINMHEGRTGVNRGNFKDGYIYEGEDIKTGREFKTGGN